MPPSPTDTPALPTEGMRVKYDNKHPIVQWMVGGFLRHLDALVDACPAERVLEVGCGEGFLTDRFQERKPGALVCGLDDSLDILRVAGDTFDRTPFMRGTVYGLPFGDAAFDLVVACEMLEHLDVPERALAEIHRVARSHVVMSVPNEPVWRILNMARGKYWRELGNTPGHLQNWRPAQFIAMVERTFEVIDVRRPFPWTMLLCRK